MPCFWWHKTQSQSICTHHVVLQLYSTCHWRQSPCSQTCGLQRSQTFFAEIDCELASFTEAGQYWINWLISVSWLIDWLIDIHIYNWLVTHPLWYSQGDRLTAFKGIKVCCCDLDAQRETTWDTILLKGFYKQLTSLQYCRSYVMFTHPCMRMHVAHPQWL